MKSTGIVRKIDELGRVVLPVECRRLLEIENRDSLEILVEGNAIILKKYEPTCIFCGESRDIQMFKGRSICPKCAKQIAERVED